MESSSRVRWIVSSLLSEEDVKAQRKRWLREVIVAMQSFEASGRPQELYETVDLLVKMGTLPGGDSFAMMRHVSEQWTESLGRAPEGDDFRGRALAAMLGDIGVG